MLKNILNLEGAKQLSNNEQKSIKGAGFTKKCEFAGDWCAWVTGTSSGEGNCVTVNGKLFCQPV